jgi:dihydropteroate synthase
MKRYLRPLGILSGTTARGAVAAGLALPLAGGPLAYSLVEIIERHGPGDIRRKIVSVSADALVESTSPLEGEVDNAQRWRVGGMAQPSHRNLKGGESAPHPALRADLPLKGGGAFEESMRTPKPLIMGIVNTTPDSFSDGGAYLDPAPAIAHAEAMIRAGAGIVDIGGESTRPGATPVPVDEEIRRVVPVIAGIRDAAEKAGVTISIDTRNARTMRAALDAGAAMINDVSALTHDPASLSVAAAAAGQVVLMHMQGEPATMQQSPTYDDVVLDVYDGLEARIAAARAAGIGLERIVVDPGIGFGKTATDNLALLDQLSLFHGLGVPLLVGVSRKGFLARLSANEPADRRLGGSLAAGLAAAAQGAQILRVHDVPETIQALRIAAAIRGA